MPTFRYVGNDERDIPLARLVVQPGETFEVSDEVAAGLEGQTLFEKQTKKQTKSTAPKPAPKGGDE